MTHSLKRGPMRRYIFLCLIHFSIGPTWEAMNFTELADSSYKSNLTWEDLKYEKLNKVTGKQLKVVVVKIFEKGLEETARGTLRLPNGTTVYIYGGGTPALWDLRDSLDLKLDFQVVDNWYDMWKEVSERDSDFGSTLVTFQSNMKDTGVFKTVSMLHPLSSMPSLVYFRQPENKAIRLFHLEPLKKDAWLGFCLCWILCVIVCHFMHRFPLITDNLTFCQFCKRYSISEFILWNATITSGKDYPASRRDPGVYKMSVRIAMIAAIHLSVIATAIYTAKIVVVFSKESNLIRKPEDLLRYGYEIGSWSLVHLDRLFQGIELGTTRRNQALSDVLNNTREYVLKKVLGIGNPNLRYAYFTHPDGFYVEYLVTQEYQAQICKISSFSSTVKSPRSMYIKKESGLREVFNWKILQLMERGLNSRYQRDNLRLYEHTCHKPTNTFEKLDLQHTFFIFLVLILGVTAALSIIFCEYIYDRICFQKLYDMSFYILQKW